MWHVVRPAQEPVHAGAGGGLGGSMGGGERAAAARTNLASERAYPSARPM